MQVVALFLQATPRDAAGLSASSTVLTCGMLVYELLCCWFAFGVD